ncbi:MAG: WG repeat-containing protein, partial [Bacteroidia bacterium]
MKSPLILLILSCLSLTALAQSPCEEAAQIIQLAEQDLVARNYERAINRLLDVKDICPQEGAKVNALIKKAFQQIEGEKAAAQRAQREADKQKRSAQQAQKTAQAAQQESLQEKQRADSSLSVANRVLDQMYFYEEKFGLTLKNIAQERETPKYRYGYIDRQGKEVIAFEYEEATPFSHMDGFARVQIDKQKYLLDTAGVIYR